MILPIIAYGNPVLREIAKDIQADYLDLKTLIDDMWQTMYASSGVGLAAPQINRSIRLFVIDTVQIFDSMDENEKSRYTDMPGEKLVFINAKIIEQGGTPWKYNEGCLSIPKIREDVERSETVEMEFLDENFEPQTRIFIGITARVILHEYDHLEGKLFIDYLTPLKRKLIKSKLTDISKGKVQVDYKIKL